MRDWLRFLAEIQTPEDLEELREDLDIEAKAAQGQDRKGELPQDLWESYSAFANTAGGILLLGVKEKTDGRFQVLGLSEPERLKQQFFDLVSNPQKVSTNLIGNEQVQILNLGDKAVLTICIPAAKREQKPVYLKQQMLTQTYRRGATGDYRCSEQEVKRMLADASELPLDREICEGFDLGDIEPKSLSHYRQMFRNHRPEHPWNEEPDLAFLGQIGAYRQDRNTGQKGLTVAGLLMFGQGQAIQERFPYYFPDYQEKDPEDELSWRDRLRMDGTWSGNLFDFFRKTIGKLTTDLKVPFQQEGLQRIDDTPVHKALREALVNTLAHADYGVSGSLLIQKWPDRFVFQNPGSLRLPKAVIWQGGQSDPRNPTLLKLFDLIGFGERAGSGIPKIRDAWQRQHWRQPELRENSGPCVRLEMPMMSLLPAEALQELSQRWPQKFALLDELERLILVTAYLEKNISHARIREIASEHSRDITQAFQKLKTLQLLQQAGHHRQSSYQLFSDAKTLQQLSFLDTSSVPTGNIDSPTGNIEPPTGNIEPLIKISETLWKDLQDVAQKARTKKRLPQAELDALILELCQQAPLSVQQLALLLERSPDSLKNHYLLRLVKTGHLKHVYDKPTHTQQAYLTPDQ